MANYFFDNHCARYELISNHESDVYNWLFFPGGPGIDSCYLGSLASILKLPGNIWLVDLPGNGSNIEDIPSDYHYDLWFEIFVPIIKSFENPIVVGHSFGGMFPLLFPELEELLHGIVILNSVPSLWLEEAVIYSKQFSLPDITSEVQNFKNNPSQESFLRAIDAHMPYYFSKKNVEKGRALLSEVPFPFQPAIWWLRKAIEMNFQAQWIPQKVPTLIVGGKYDCIHPFTLFKNDSRFQRTNIELTYLENSGHFSWVENPKVIKDAFEILCLRIATHDLTKTDFHSENSANLSYATVPT